LDFPVILFVSVNQEKEVGLTQLLHDTEPGVSSALACKIENSTALLRDIFDGIHHKKGY